MSADQIFPDPVLNAKPTAKVVYSVLDRRGELTVEDLVEETGQSKRAVQEALRELSEQGAVTAKSDITEPRRYVWQIADG